METRQENSLSFQIKLLKAEAERKVELIRRFAVILQVIASGEIIKIQKFKEYTRKTAERYIELYNKIGSICQQQYTRSLCMVLT